jgi:hypothetical protein
MVIPNPLETDHRNENTIAFTRNMVVEVLVLEVCNGGRVEGEEEGQEVGINYKGGAILQFLKF